MLSENEVINQLHQAGVDTSLVVAVDPLGDGVYLVSFETLEIEFNEQEILQALEDAGFEPSEGYYESPADRGAEDSPTDVFPYYYIEIQVE